MRCIVVLFVFLLIGAGVYPAPAKAQMVCGDRNEAITSLEKSYSEVPVSMGLASNGSVVEVFASEAGTFTIILTQPSGFSCLVVSGESWEELPKQLAGAKS